MKFGINRWSFPAHLTAQQCFALARKLGCDHIELNLERHGDVSLDSTREQITALAAAARRKHLSISSLATGLYWRDSPTDNDSAVRAQAQLILKKQIDVASWLAVDTILVVPGMVTAEVAYDLAYERARTFIAESLPHAESRGIHIGIENVWNQFLLSPLEMRSFIDSFSSPFVCAYVDVGNVLAFGYPQHWLRILGQRVRRVHVKDYDQAVPGMGGFRNLLQGTLDWDAVAAALRDIDYVGYVTAEIGGYPQAPGLGLKHAVESLRMLFDPQRKSYLVSDAEGTKVRSSRSAGKRPQATKYA